jgi:hypothetical protein
MLILRVPAVIAAVLFMSSVSAQALEFVDRPGPISGVFNAPSAVRAIPSGDHSRRQINDAVLFLPATVAETKLADRPRPVSLVRIRVASMIFGKGPGRLSAEFSAVSRDASIRFEHRPAMVTQHFKPTVTIATRFGNRPDAMLNRFKASAAVSFKFEDRPGFASSPEKTTTPIEFHAQPSSVEFCIGSIAPCGPLSFAQQPQATLMRAAVARSTSGSTIE